MSSPTAYDQEQVQKLTELGTHLRNLRTKKGLSLEEIATKTMIQQRFFDDSTSFQNRSMYAASFAALQKRWAWMGFPWRSRFPWGKPTSAAQMQK
jgi:hypothetical protein